MEENLVSLMSEVLQRQSSQETLTTEHLVTYSCFARRQKPH